MIVVCTGCSAKFKVADEKVGPKGARVRCSKCSTVFLVRHDEPVAPTLPAVASPPARSVPPPLPSTRPPPQRDALDLDLEPASPPPRAGDQSAALPLPDDPFGAGFSPVSGGAPVAPDDPFAPRQAEADPFAAVQAPVPDDLLRPPPAPPEQAAADPFDLDPFGGSSGEPSQGDDLALEERSIAPPRPRPESSAPVDDPFAAAPAFDRSLVDFAAGQPGDVPPLAPDLPGIAPPAPPAPPPAPPAPPLQVDPFASAAVDADPLAVAPTRRGPRAAEAPDREVDVAPLAASHGGRLRTIAVNAVSLAVLLAVALALLVVWRGGGRAPASLRPSSLLAALDQRPRAEGPLTTAHVTSGLYERERGAPLLFVRGLVVAHGPGPVGPVTVTVELVRGGQVLASGSARAGAALGPEALHGAADAAALARLAEEAAAGAPAQLRPGETAPFLVAFAEYPEDLAGTSLRVAAEPVR